MTKTAVRLILIFTLLTGIVYPLGITAVAKLVFPRQAAGSLILKDGNVAGSELIGQQFDDPRYFWGRVSATTPFPYNAASSTGSNYGPQNPDLKKAMEGRRTALVAADPGNPLPVPIDLVTSSGSGLDPHISPEAAQYQAARVARARGMDVARVNELIASHTAERQFGVLGEPMVNVVLLNRDLDRQ